MCCTERRDITCPYTLGMVDSPVLRRRRCGVWAAEVEPPSAAGGSAGAAEPPPSVAGESSFASMVKKPLFCCNM